MKMYKFVQMFFVTLRKQQGRSESWTATSGLPQGRECWCLRVYGLILFELLGLPWTTILKPHELITLGYCCLSLVAGVLQSKKHQCHQQSSLLSNNHPVIIIPHACSWSSIDHQLSNWIIDRIIINKHSSHHPSIDHPLIINYMNRTGNRNRCWLWR